MTPDLHDGFLRGIEIVAEGQIQLRVSEENGTPHVIHLDGVDQLCAHEFRQGNTLFDITVLPAAKVELGHLLPLGYAIGDSFIQVAHDKVRRLGLYLVSVNPSYGCSLTALVRDIRIGDGTK